MIMILKKATAVVSVVAMKNWNLNVKNIMVATIVDLMVTAGNKGIVLGMIMVMIGALAVVMGREIAITKDMAVIINTTVLFVIKTSEKN